MASIKSVLVFTLFFTTSVVLANPPTEAVVRSFNTGLSPSAPQAVDLCTSQQCTSYATYIRESMASNYTKINPCDDFEAYACDGWRDRNPMRKDQGSISITVVLMESIQALLKDILEKPYAEVETFTGVLRDLDKKNFEKLTTAYKACMDEDTKIKGYGLEPMRKLLRELDKYYPVKKLEGVNEKNELTKAIVWLNNQGVAGLIGAAPSADEESPDLQTINLGPSEVQLAKQYYLKAGVMANYTTMISEMYHVLESGKGIKTDPIPADKKAALEAKAKRIIDFEGLISKNLPDPEVQNEVKYFYQRRSIAQVDKMIPEFSTLEVLRAHAPSNYTISPNTSVVVTDINFYGNLSDIIKQTPRETLHEYFQWRLFATWTPKLYKDYTVPIRRFRNVLAGKEPDVQQERYRRCIPEVDGSMGHLLGGVFIQRKFTRKDKQIGDQVIQDIRDIFAKNMKSLDWMSEEAKKVAAEKVANVVQKIGYSTKSPNDADPKSLHDYYEPLRISDNYWDNGVTDLKFTADKAWAELLKPTDRNKWEMSAPTVNAYYSPNLNEIVFPAGIMQPPIFSGDLPDYVSYGSFGAIAGHELSHGFDNSGAKYDANGRLREWWDNFTTTNFEKKTQCFEKQYEKYFIIGPDGDKVHLNGKLTLGENLADAGGLNAAFKAWKAREAAAGKPDPRIKGLEEFTNEQLFFISYGNAWCEKTRPAALLQQVFSDAHSPAEHRVLGTTANAAGFRKAFNCPVKAATCDLWF